MPRTGRNDPCPCGSGKKYKRCCLAKDKAERDAAARPAPSAAPVRQSLQWLEERFPDETTEAIEAYLSLVGEDSPEWIEELSPDLLQMVQINAHEWLLADAGLDLEDGEVPVRELLLGPDGPLFSAEERSWMEAFTVRPLGLYEVLEVTPGEGLRLRDLLHPDEPPVEVAERSASRSLVRWDVFGTRLVRWQDGWLLSGAIYPLRRDAEIPAFLRGLREELQQETQGDPELERAFLSVVIPVEWLLELLGSLDRELPDLVDAATGDPILLVTDHYRVKDWRRLEEVLARRDDVEGHRDEGWTRFEALDGDVRRSLLALNPGRGDRLEAFARTRSRADEGRRWLEELAGDALEHRTREMTDPKGHVAASDEPGGGARRPGRAPARGGRREKISMTTELMQQVLHTQYRTWADDKIPALGKKTPRQAVRTPEGREEVIGLLKLYEQAEERAAREQQRDPASLRFLWDAVGLDRDAILG